MSNEAGRWLLLGLVVIVAVGVIYHEYEITRPCAQPIPYSLGSIDPRFGVTSSTVLAEVAAAAQIWDTAAGRQLFVYSPTGALKVNLVYDAREADAELGVKITAEMAQEDSERAAIEDERATLPPSQAAAFNAQVDSFNASIDATNAEIAQYNQTAGQPFEEGEYVSDASGRRVNIFEFVSDTQLERVLAHELGHAIGLGHNTNPQSIMYAQNESGNLVPTADDLAALKGVCGSEISIK